jgi:hypothetical protein
MFSALADRVAEVIARGSRRWPLARERWDALRLRVRDVRRSVRRAGEQARVQTDQALAALGLPPTPPNPVIDVAAHDAGAAGPTRALVRGAVRGLALVSATVLLGVALLALGIFAGAAFLAFLVVTRGLGLRIDVGSRAAAAS